MPPARTPEINAWPRSVALGIAASGSDQLDPRRGELGRPDNLPLLVLHLLDELGGVAVVERPVEAQAAVDGGHTALLEPGRDLLVLEAISTVHGSLEDLPFRDHPPGLCGGGAVGQL